MAEWASGDVLSPHNIVAKNYGADHENKIHSDEGAAKFGFAGALVPGVALYAYLTRPVVDLWGEHWLARGTMSAKFIKPIYDRELVQARAQVVSVAPIELSLELVNPANEICAVGTAGLPDALPMLDVQAYPAYPLPPSEQRRAASISSFQVGEALGSLSFTLDLQHEGARFLENMVETAPRYHHVCHPAYWIAQANELLMQNIALGPWIHTASETQHLALARDGERLSLRGRVAELAQRRGHEIITADLALFGENDRPLVQIRHSAIIKLRD